MMYQVAASEHSAGLANYENLINTARFIRNYFPPMHAEGPRFIDRAALNAFANISTEELRATRETLATHLHIPDSFGPLHFEEDSCLSPSLEAAIMACTVGHELVNEDLPTKS